MDTDKTVEQGPTGESREPGEPKRIFKLDRAQIQKLEQELRNALTQSASVPDAEKPALANHILAQVRSGACDCWCVGAEMDDNPGCPRPVGFLFTLRKHDNVRIIAAATSSTVHADEWRDVVCGPLEAAFAAAGAKTISLETSVKRLEDIVLAAGFKPVRVVYEKEIGHVS